METCQFKDFMKVLEPWLDRDYIRKVILTDQGNLTLFFTDGGQKDYSIDDCSKTELEDVLHDLQKKGIVVEKAASTNGNCSV